MSESDSERKHALECMRLATDCMQLVGDVHDPTLRSHFLRMAGVWRILADRGPSADAQTMKLSKQFCCSARGFRNCGALALR